MSNIRLYACAYVCVFSALRANLVEVLWQFHAPSEGRHEAVRLAVTDINHREVSCGLHDGVAEGFQAWVCRVVTGRLE